MHGHWALDTEQSGWTLDTEEWWLDIGTRASARLAEESLDLSSPVLLWPVIAGCKAKTKQEHKYVIWNSSLPTSRSIRQWAGRGGAVSHQLFPQTNKRDRYFLSNRHEHRHDEKDDRISSFRNPLKIEKILFFRLRPSDSENVPGTQYFDRNAHKRGQRAGGAFEKKNDKV